MIFVGTAFISGCSLGIAIITALNKEESKSLELKVESDPSDAEVYLDGKKLGIAPITVKIIGLNAKHKIEVTKMGYQSETATVCISFCHTEDQECLIVIRADETWSEVKDNILSFVLESRHNP